VGSVRYVFVKYIHLHWKILPILYLCTSINTCNVLVLMLIHAGTFGTLFVILVMGVADQLQRVKYKNIIVVAQRELTITVFHSMKT